MKLDSMKKNDALFVRRLMMLADKLASLPKERFDFKHWVGSDWKGKKDLSCGTTACSFGWACTIPALQKAGLKLDSIHGMFTPTLEGISLNGSSPKIAARKVFGLSYYEFDYLFIPRHQQLADIVIGGVYTPSEKCTPQEMAIHIRHFVSYKYGV